MDALKRVRLAQKQTNGWEEPCPICPFLKFCVDFFAEQFSSRTWENITIFSEKLHLPIIKLPNRNISITFSREFSPPPRLPTFPLEASGETVCAPSATVLRHLTWDKWNIVFSVLYAAWPTPLSSISTFPSRLCFRLRARGLPCRAPILSRSNALEIQDVPVEEVDGRLDPGQRVGPRPVARIEAAAVDLRDDHKCLLPTGGH